MRTSFRVRSTTPVASPSLMLTGVPSGLVPKQPKENSGPVGKVWTARCSSLNRLWR
jgi:hypothetical protein